MIFNSIVDDAGIYRLLFQDEGKNQHGWKIREITMLQRDVINEFKTDDTLKREKATTKKRTKKK